MPTWCRWSQLKNSWSQPTSTGQCTWSPEGGEVVTQSPLAESYHWNCEKPFIFVSLQQRACFWVYEGYITKNASEVFVKERLLKMFCLSVSGLFLTPKVDQRFMKSKCSQDQFYLTSFFMIGELGFFQITKHPTHTCWYMFVWCSFFPSCFGSYEGLALTAASLARMRVINRHWCMWIQPNISSTTRGFWKSVWHIVKVFPAEYSCTGWSGCKVLKRNVTVCQDMKDFGRIATKSVTEK